MLGLGLGIVDMAVTKKVLGILENTTIKVTEGLEGVGWEMLCCLWGPVSTGFIAVVWQPPSIPKKTEIAVTTGLLRCEELVPSIPSMVTL